MDSKLVAKLALKPHPFPDEIGANLEAWGAILLSVVSDSERIELLEWEWDLNLLVEWFIENRVKLCDERLSVKSEADVLPGESLAQALCRLQDRDFSENDEPAAIRWFGYLFEYRGRHSLHRILSGAAIPDVIIGCNDRMGEISLCTPMDTWSYMFDMRDFCDLLAAEARALLVGWSETTEHIDTKQRANSLLARLEDNIQEYPLPARCCE